MATTARGSVHHHRSRDAASRRRRPSRRRGRPPLPVLAALALLALMLGLAAGRSGGDEQSVVPSDQRAERAESGGAADPQAANGPLATPLPDPYVPLAGEVYPNAKQLAGRVVARLTTYEDRENAGEVARTAGSLGGGQAPRRAAVALHAEGRTSVGEVVYAQLGGASPTAASVMVVVRQTRRGGGRPQETTRTIDVRLERDGGPWRLDEIASVGGSPVGRPATLSAAARAVVDHPRIDLPDSARWDIYRGRVDEELLETMLRVAREVPYAVAVLSGGHPYNVFGTDRRSGHTLGRAVDIYAVGRRPVIRERSDPNSPARRLAVRLLARGAYQLGSPWVLPPGAPRSFTDVVHQDHLHLQQTPAPNQTREAVQGAARAGA